MNFAQITISGNVGQAPEIKEVNGTKVANFSIAVNESYNTDGEKRKAFKIKLAGTGSTFRLMGGVKKDQVTNSESPKVEDDDEVPF